MLYFICFTQKRENAGAVVGETCPGAFELERSCHLEKAIAERGHPVHLALDYAEVVT
jgi:hypothetical protein